MLRSKTGFTNIRTLHLYGFGNQTHTDESTKQSSKIKPVFW
ncbi:hypothetical protein ACP6PL_02725 [Dapis sp. BLCC M126]